MSDETKNDGPLRPTQIRQVGAIAASWSYLEHLVDSTIWTLADLDPQTGSCVTRNLMTMHAKLKSLISLCQLRGGSADLIKQLHQFQQSQYSTGEKRNRAVHDPWVYTLHENQFVPGQLRTPTDKQFRFAIEPVSEQELEDTLD